MATPQAFLMTIGNYDTIAVYLTVTASDTLADGGVTISDGLFPT